MAAPASSRKAGAPTAAAANAFAAIVARAAASAGVAASASAWNSAGASTSAAAPPAAAAASRDAAPRAAASSSASHHHRSDDDDEVDLPSSRAAHLPLARPSPCPSSSLLSAGGFHRHTKPARFDEEHARGNELYADWMRLIDGARAARASGDASLSARLLRQAARTKQLHEEERARANMRIAAERNKRHVATRPCDLHGQTVASALEIVAPFLEHELDVPHILAQTCGPVSIQFMVGKGNHSKGGVQKLKEPVERLVLETGFVKGREVTWDTKVGAVTVIVTSLTPERRADMLENLPGAVEVVRAKYCGGHGRDQNGM